MYEIKHNKYAARESVSNVDMKIINTYLFFNLNEFPKRRKEAIMPKCPGSRNTLINLGIKSNLF
jgi:hypothetical protein